MKIRTFKCGAAEKIWATRSNLPSSTSFSVLTPFPSLGHLRMSNCRLEHQDWGTPWTELFDLTDEQRAAVQCTPNNSILATVDLLISTTSTTRCSVKAGGRVQPHLLPNPRQTHTPLAHHGYCLSHWTPQQLTSLQRLDQLQDLERSSLDSER